MTQTDLDAARGEFAARLEYMRESMDRKVGSHPRRSGWWVLLLAGAVGVALAGRARGGRELEDQR